MRRDAPQPRLRPQRRRSASPRRALLALTLGLAAVVAAWIYVGRVGGGLGAFPALSTPRAGDARSSPWKPRFRPLSSVDRDLMRRQRSLVDGQARRHVGTGLTGRSLDDLRVLQAILDHAPPAPGETFALQALGVALGDVMAAQLGLSWVVFEDQLGRSRALRLGATDVVLFPVTMISKRVERDVPFRVEELYRKAARTVEGSRSGGASSGG